MDQDILSEQVSQDPGLSPGSPSPGSCLTRVLLLPCVFSSGLCALIYQMVWQRELRLIFGASTAASAAVLAIFMGGLGLGSVLLGKKVDRLATPLRFYGRLELCIAIGAGLTPLLLDFVRSCYIGLGGTPALGLVVGTIVRLLLTSLVLLLPTLLMGGTLPALARAIQGRDEGRRQVALLYAVNTLGAVAGTMLSTFYLLEQLGNRSTLWAACSVNLAVAVIALQLARQTSPAVRQFCPQAAMPDHPAPATAPARFVLVAAATAGFAFFLMELVWYRMLGPLLGGSTFTFGLILAVALLGIGLGSLVYSLSAGRATLVAFALVCACEAFFIALPYALGDRLALLTMALQSLSSLGLTVNVAQWSIVALIVVFPASFLAGVQFPMLIALLGRGPVAVGKHTGLAYGWNTIGAIAGSLAGGFGLLPLLNALGAWRLVTILLVALAGVALWLSWRDQRRWLRPLPAVAVGGSALLLLTATGPTAVWRHTPIGAGRVDLRQASMNDYRRFVNSRRRAVCFEAEGVESSLALVDQDGYAFLVNGKSDGNSRSDASMQVMFGLMAALPHPDPRQALVVGLGTGSTAGWLGAVPFMERVDVVELEPAVRQVAAHCTPVNHDALNNPKVHLWFGDAREVMLTSRAQYDLILSEPSNPYRAGVASLFTREFYAAAARRLRPGGVFAQWVQAYEVDGATVSTVYATLGSVFPFVETWEANNSDLVFLASMQPFVYDVPALRRRLAEEPFRSAVASTWRMTDLEGVFAHYVANSEMARAIMLQGLPQCTDDRNLLEFGFARSLGRSKGFSIEGLRGIAQNRGFHRPALRNGEVDWDKVKDRHVSLLVREDQVELKSYSSDPGFNQRFLAKVAWSRDNPAAALEAWQRQAQPPGDLMELLLVAYGLADRGDEQALGYIQQLRAWLPTEADIVQARLYLRIGKEEQGLELANRCLLAFRVDPWPLSTVMRSHLELTAETALKPGQEAEALRLLDTLQAPFAVGLLEEERNAARVQLAGHLDAVHRTHRLLEVLTELEDHVPWAKSFLQIRLAGYSRVADSRAAKAARDLAAFEANETQPFLLDPQAGPPAPSEAPRRWLAFPLPTVPVHAREP